ncbi:uncharacterized protein LACBIDRAFT_335844 [Laccaria bicolor S238N-H82]|uniref:Predicted protein n=1 Tax=Laccaria bicolor (strain S238N-H82 / ATCC MYA-4686) TaxID=486041 RepID=B0E3L0_LACBS|nr:uncharacterized protein LACBIDRAFT_335844 [Laccaria bicolor S238N-H82]EDQ98571.1 predicted protein [Laccaria bicolor S238N-H82]|eukprot:XP_001890780.1 predicted protein [Laccaria bicolor S238N-H82]
MPDVVTDSEHDPKLISTPYLLVEIHPLHVYDISKGEEAALVAGLEGEEVAYKFRKPWEEGYIRYQGSLPQEGAQNAADRHTEMHTLCSLRVTWPHTTPRTDELEEVQSKAARILLSTMKKEGKIPTSSDAHWKDLRVSYTPSQLDAVSVLNSYGLILMPDALLLDLDELSLTKPSLLETALYPMFGQIVWQVAHRLGHLYGRSSEFAMEKAGLLRKEKRAPNWYNMFKIYASRMKPEEGDHEGLQLWNRATNEEYKKLMEGATTKEEKDERIQEAVSFIKNQVNEEGTNVRDANLRFASYMKEIRDLITNIKCRDKSFDVAGILVYSGKNLTARNKTGFFMSSEDLQALCTREEWPIPTLMDIFVSRVRAMHADQQIKQSMEELNVARYGCLAEKDRHKSAPWTTWPNLAYQFKLVITGWDSAMVNIVFCPGFAPMKITSSQWKHLSTLIVKKLLVVKPWSDEQRLIQESEACFGEIPVIINSEGLLMVFVKDSSKWVHGNCSISAPMKKRDRKGDTSSPRCPRRNDHMTPPWPRLKKNSSIGPQESTAVCRNNQKWNVLLNANVTSPSPPFPITCFIPNFDELNTQSPSLTHSRTRRHQLHRLVQFLNPSLVLQLTLPPHLDQYLSLSLVLRVMLAFQANMLGQGRTLKVQLLPSCVPDLPLSIHHCAVSPSFCLCPPTHLALSIPFPIVLLIHRFLLAVPSLSLPMPILPLFTYTLISFTQFQLHSFLTY